MSYAARKCALTVPAVRSWEVRALAVSTQNAMTATRIPSSRAADRAAR